MKAFYFHALKQDRNLEAIGMTYRDEHFDQSLERIAAGYGNYTLLNQAEIHEMARRFIRGTAPAPLHGEMHEVRQILEEGGFEEIEEFNNALKFELSEEEPQDESVVARTNFEVIRFSDVGIYLSNIYEIVDFYKGNLCGRMQVFHEVRYNVANAGAVSRNLGMLSEFLAGHVSVCLSQDRLEDAYCLLEAAKVSRSVMQALLNDLKPAQIQTIATGLIERKEYDFAQYIYRNLESPLLSQAFESGISQGLMNVYQNDTIDDVIQGLGQLSRTPDILLRARDVVSRAIADIARSKDVDRFSQLSAALANQPALRSELNPFIKSMARMMYLQANSSKGDLLAWNTILGAAHNIPAWWNEIRQEVWLIKGHQMPRGYNPKQYIM